MGKTAVLYLSRKGNPAEWTGGFLDSFLSHAAGAEHSLVFVLKGYAEGETDPVLAARRKELAQAPEEWRVGDDIFPIGVWFRAAAALDLFERIVCLNSQSRILAGGWLGKLLNPFERSANCGAVGATGSFEGLAPDEFPNIHLRTTGFAVDRRLFLSLAPGQQVTKYDGNLFEAGPQGFTRQLQQRGLAPLVVDRPGKAWAAEDWPASRTFRSGAQEGLLIADNRTRDYAIAGLAKRRKLARLAFGAAGQAEASPLWDRWAARKRFY